MMTIGQYALMFEAAAFVFWAGVVIGRALEARWYAKMIDEHCARLRKSFRLRNEKPSL